MTQVTSYKNNHFRIKNNITSFSNRKKEVTWVSKWTQRYLLLFSEKRGKCQVLSKWLQWLIYVLQNLKLISTACYSYAFYLFSSYAKFTLIDRYEASSNLSGKCTHKAVTSFSRKPSKVTHDSYNYNSYCFKILFPYLYRSGRGRKRDQKHFSWSLSAGNWCIWE